MENNVDIKQNVTVGNNATVGNSVLVRGRLDVKHSVRVGGWLDAPNIKGVAKGLFETEDDLNSQYPNPEAGWWAIVGNTLPGEIFVAKDGKWVDTGKTGGEPTIQSEYLEESVKELKDGLSDETTARETADKILQGNIDAEAAARKEADKTLQGNIDAEAAARKEADKTLQGNIDDETTAREAADKTLQAGIDKETSARKEADTTEAAAREEADKTLQGNIDAEAAARKEADEVMQQQLDEVLPTIKIADIDTIPASVEDAVTMAKEKKHTRYSVVSTITKMGVLDIFSDNMGHQLTEVLTSHTPLDSLNEGTYGAHMDNFVTMAYRSYHINGTKSGTWSAWKLINDKYLIESLPIVIHGTIASEAELPADTNLYYYETSKGIIQGSGTAGVRDTAYYGVGYYQPQDGQLIINLADNAIYRWEAEGGLIQIAGDLLHTSDKGEPNGVAPLEDDGLLSGNFLPKDITNDVLEFDGFYPYPIAPTIQDVGIPDGKILYCALLGGFVANKSNTYGNVWPNSEWYGTFQGIGKAVAPFVGKLYVDRSENVPYRWTGSGLVAVSVGQKEELARQAAEEKRVAAEAERVAAEAARAKSESTREANEEDRQEAEKARVSSERSRAVAEADRAEHEVERQAAEKQRESDFNTAAGKVEDAITAAEKVDADLDGNTFKVTNHKGETKTLDLTLVKTEEVVTVQVKSEVSSVSASGVTLSVYINHGETPTTYTTDSEGKATFAVPIGSYYEIYFPDFADTEEISPIGYTATLPTRTIEATYKAYEGVKAQITVQAQKHEDGVSSVLEGVVLSVKIEDGEAVEYTTDAEGKASFEVAIGKTYTVTMPKVDGYYVADGVYEHTHHATTAAHTIHIMYHQYRVGIFILDKDGKDYTLAEWQAAGKTADEAVLLECSTELLHDNDAVVYFDPVAMSKRSYQSYQWQNAYTQLSTVKSQQTYDGVGQTTNAITEAASIGGSVPAATHARSHEIVIDGETMYGYLGGCLQWVQLWANKEAVDEVLTALYGDTTKLLSDYTANKWTADQSNADYAYYFASSVGNNGKNYGSAVVPFYAY